MFFWWFSLLACVLSFLSVIFFYYAYGHHARKLFQVFIHKTVFADVLKPNHFSKYSIQFLLLRLCNKRIFIILLKIVNEKK